MELKDQVAEYSRRRAADPDRWLAGMARLQAPILDGIYHAPTPDLGPE